MDQLDRTDLLRYKRKWYLPVLAAVILSLSAGCGKKEGPAGSSPEAAATEAALGAAGGTSGAGAQEEAGAVGAAGETAAAQPSARPEKPVKGEAVGMITGVVTDAGMSAVTIRSEKYPDGITFSKEDAAAEFSEGLLAEHEITVFYRGEIQGNDASGVTVELLRDKRDGDEGREAAWLSGIVQSVGMSVITILREDGSTVSFELDPRPVNTTEGPAEEEKVTVVYSFERGRQTEGLLAPELLRRQ